MLRPVVLPMTAVRREMPSNKHAVAPVYAALRDGLQRFVARRVHPSHVEDLVQDIMLRMHERAADLREDARVAGWAFRIAQSVVADHHRAHRPERAPAGLSDPDEVAEDAPEEVGNMNEIVAGWLQPMLALLPDEYEEAVALVDVQGLSQKEYAAHAGLTLSGAKSRVQRGRRLLEEMVRACCDLEVDARGNVIGYQRRHCQCLAD